MTSKREKLRDLTVRYTKVLNDMLLEIKALEDEIIAEETADGKCTILLPSIN